MKLTVSKVIFEFDDIGKRFTSGSPTLTTTQNTFANTTETPENLNGL